MSAIGDDPNDLRMTLGEHLEELRRRILRALLGLLAASAVMLTFGDALMEALEFPYRQVMLDLHRDQPLETRVAERGFLTYLKVSLLAGLIVASPWVFYQLWSFVAAGLYRHERRAIVLLVPFSALLFAGGALFYLFVVAQPLLRFFITFNDRMGWQTRLTAPEYIALICRMMLIFGLAFQMPLIVAGLGWLGLVTTQTLARYRRYVIVSLFVLAALVTSLSPLDQVLLALPMWLLFELGVLLVFFIQRRRRADQP